MRVLTTLMIGVCSLAGAALLPVRVAAQTELDRVVARVNNRIITRSDIERARRLQLVPDVSSDDAARRGLEDRTLILAELSRMPLAQQGGDGEGISLADWEARVGGPARAAELLRDTQTTDASMQAWLRDDSRIQAYLKRQFSNVPDEDRGKATADWITRLRQRAGLR